MYHLLPFLYEMPYLYVLQMAFTVWMLIDASRRRVEYYWYWIILGTAGFGAWAYFFAYKMRDFRGGQGFSFVFQRPPSLAELRHRVEQSPTQTNQLDLAERLIERGEHAEAAPLLEAVLKREPDYCRALYYLADCQLHLGHPELAVALLEKLIAREPRWEDYHAWPLLREARVRAGNTHGALAACQELVHMSPRLEHKCLLAEQLLTEGQKDEARVVLEKGIDDFRYSPWSSRWRNRQWASHARRLQKRIGQESRG